MSIRIGIPRALMYHYYYPAWRVFFENLGLTVVLSLESNKDIVNKGVKLAVDDICLPFKVYYGHVLELKKEVDYLFVPRFISLGKYNYVCPKFMGLPDMLKANIDNLPELIEPVIDLRNGIYPLRKIAHEIGHKFNKKFWLIEKAYRKAKIAYRKFLELQKKGIDTEMAIDIAYQETELEKSKTKTKIHETGQEFTRENDQISSGFSGGGSSENPGLNIAVLGHAYILNDRHISMNIIQHLKDMGVNVITVEMNKESIVEKAARKQSKRVFWYFNRKVMGAAYYLLSKKSIDGIIQVTAFACGPDSLVKELIDIKGRKKDLSILDINIDEHSGEAGLMTRLEAFIDLLERRKLA